MSDDVFARIQKATASLNKKADRATEYLRGVEVQLSELGVGVEVFANGSIEDRQYTKKDFDQSRDDYLVEDRVYVGYGKIRGKWGLILRTETLNNPNDPENSEVEGVATEFLLSADRASRVKAVPLIPALLESIEQELAEVTGRMEEVLSARHAKK